MCFVTSNDPVWPNEDGRQSPAGAGRAPPPRQASLCAPARATHAPRTPHAHVTWPGAWGHAHSSLCPPARVTWPVLGAAPAAEPLAGSPLRGAQAATAEQVADGARGGQLGVAGAEDHAEVLGNDGRLRAALHLQGGVQGLRRKDAPERPDRRSPPNLSEARATTLTAAQAFPGWHGPTLRPGGGGGVRAGPRGPRTQAWPLQPQQPRHIARVTAGSACEDTAMWLSPEPRELLTKLAGAGDLFGQSVAGFLSPANRCGTRWSPCLPRSNCTSRWAPSPSLLTPNLPRPLCLARNTHAPSLLLCSQGAHSPGPWGPRRLLLSCCLGHGCNIW